MSEKEPSNLRFLRRLVTVLTATMILGVLTIIALLVIRLQSTGDAPQIVAPANLAIPAGERVAAITVADGYYLVVTTDDVLLVFDATGRTVTQRIPLQLR